MVVGAYMGWECYVYNLQGMCSDQGQVESAGECACSERRHSGVAGDGQEAVPSVWLTVAGCGVTHTVYVCITAFLLKLCKLLVCCYGTD